MDRDKRNGHKLTAEEIADLLSPAVVAHAPWIRPISSYAVRTETTALSAARFG